LPGPKEFPTLDRESTQVVELEHRRDGPDINSVTPQKPTLVGRLLDSVGGKRRRVRDDPDIRRAAAGGKLNVFYQMSPSHAKDGNLREMSKGEYRDPMLKKVEDGSSFFTKGLYPCSAAVYVFGVDRGKYAMPVHMPISNGMDELADERFIKVNDLVLAKARRELGSIRGVDVLLVPGVNVEGKRAEADAKGVAEAVASQAPDARVDVTQCRTPFEKSSGDVDRWERAAFIRFGKDGADIKVIDYRRDDESRQRRMRYRKA